MRVSIYFAGTIAKDHEVMDSKWTEEDFTQLQEYISPFLLNFMNPAHRTDDMSDPKSVFGRDMTQIYLSDIVFVDGRHRRGLGVGAEMMWAKFLAKPLLILVPDESYYKKSNVDVLGNHVPQYIHPFVDTLCDQMVTTLKEGGEWIVKWAKRDVGMVKDLTTVYEAMQYYQNSQYEKDDPMKEMIAGSEELIKQFESIATL